MLRIIACPWLLLDEGLGVSKSNQLPKPNHLSCIRIGDELPSYVALAAWGYGDFCRPRQSSERGVLAHDRYAAR